jgi:hypothetical protein
MKKLFIIIGILFITSFAWSGEIAERNIVALFNLGAMTKVQVYNPTNNPIKVIFTIDGKEVEFIWEEIKPDLIIEEEPLEPID